MRRTLGTVARALVLSVLMLLLGYTAGRLQARNERTLAAAQRAEEQAAQQQALQRARSAAESAAREGELLRDHVALLEGRRETQHALDALDARNFGIAQRALRHAERELAGVSRHVEGLDVLRQRLGSTDLEIAANLGEQRDTVVELVRELDALVTREDLPSGLATTAGEQVTP